MKRSLAYTSILHSMQLFMLFSTMYFEIEFVLKCQEKPGFSKKKWTLLWDLVFRCLEIEFSGSKSVHRVGQSLLFCMVSLEREILLPALRKSIINASGFVLFLNFFPLMKKENLFNETKRRTFEVHPYVLDSYGSHPYGTANSLSHRLSSEE